MLRRHFFRSLLLLILFLSLPGCKKKIGTSDAIKADLKNYLQVELPKAAGLLPLIDILSKKLKDEKESGEKGEQAEATVFDVKNDLDFKKEGQKLAQALEALNKIQPATADVSRLHERLKSGVAAINDNIQKMADFQGNTSGLKAFTGMVKGIKGIVDGIEDLQDWREQLEAGCKANGLEAEFKEYERKYGLN